MTSIVRPRATASPCTQVCRIDSVTNLCEGCGRTLSEIAMWGSMTDVERAHVWNQLPARREKFRSGKPD